MVQISHQHRVFVALGGNVGLNKTQHALRLIEGGAGRSAIDPQILMALWLSLNRYLCPRTRSPFSPQSPSALDVTCPRPPPQSFPITRGFTASARIALTCA